MDADKETPVIARTVYLDRDLFRAFKAKAVMDGKRFNQELNDIIAFHLGVPTRQVQTTRPARSA